MKRTLSVAAEPVSVNLTLKGNPNAVARVLAFLGMLQYNGNAGHSGMFAMGWDGDGADQIRIDSPEVDELIKQLKDGYQACSAHGSDIEYMGDFGSFGVARIQPDSRKIVWRAGQKGETK